MGYDCLGHIRIFNDSVQRTENGPQRLSAMGNTNRYQLEIGNARAIEND